MGGKIGEVFIFMFVFVNACVSGEYVCSRLKDQGTNPNSAHTHDLSTGSFEYGREEKRYTRERERENGNENIQYRNTCVELKNCDGII